MVSNVDGRHAFAGQLGPRQGTQIGQVQKRLQKCEYLHPSSVVNKHRFKWFTSIALQEKQNSTRESQHSISAATGAGYD